MMNIEEKGIDRYPKRLPEDIEQGRTCAEQSSCLNCPWVSECYLEDYDDEDYMVYGYYDDDIYYDEDYYDGFDD